jgi:hypothetical protein
MVENMLEIIAFTTWIVFVAYATWYFTSAKHTTPISPDEARLLWKIHKQTLRCDARRWRKIKNGNKTVGFECECGYKHVQKRPVSARAPTIQVEMEPSITERFGIPPYPTKASQE